MEDTTEENFMLPHPDPELEKEYTMEEALERLKIIIKSQKLSKHDNN